MMVKNFLKWCPNGCGKSVKFFGFKFKSGSKYLLFPRVSIYVCTRCKKAFDKSLENEIELSQKEKECLDNFY